MSNEEPIVGYCLKCKEKHPMDNPQAEWAANGSPATRGTCPVCGTNMYLRGRTAAHETLPKPDLPPIAPRKKKKGAKKGKGKGAGKSGAKKAKGANGSGRRSGKLVIVESPAKAKTIGRYLGPATGALQRRPRARPAQIPPERGRGEQL